MKIYRRVEFIKGILSMTIDMLDLLNKFKNEDSNFIRDCIKNIF